MKKQYIIILVLILIVAGIFIFTKAKNGPKPSDYMQNVGMQGVSPGAKVPTIPNTNNYNTSVSAGVKEVKEFVVNGQNFSFSPLVITVKKEDKVKIILKSTEGFHDLKIDEFKVATRQLKAGEEDSIEFVADKTGAFEYYCSIGSHRAMGMKGMLIVE